MLSTKNKEKTTMMLEEFSKLTGFTPDKDYYTNVIEQEYMNSKLEKKEWCEQWLANGGIQKAYDYMKNERYTYKASYEQVVRGYNSLQDDYSKLLSQRSLAVNKNKRYNESITLVGYEFAKLYVQYKTQTEELEKLIGKLIEIKS